VRKFGVAVTLLTLILAASAVHVVHGSGPLIAPDCATDAAAVAAAKKRPTAQPPTGHIEAGKKHWAFGNTSCLNCHGSDAQGAFAPTLAGRKLAFDVVKNQIRRPCGIMPAFIPSQLTDQEIADMVAFWNSMPLPKSAAPWRFAVPAGAPKGQELALATIGCAQCHGPTLDTPRHGMAEINGDWEWFKHQVYEHQTAIRQHWAQLDHALPQVTPGPAGPPGRNRVRMGNYDRQRLPEARLKQIFDWAFDLGRLPVLTAQFTPSGPNAYTIDVINSAIRNKGVGADGVNVSVALPSKVNVVSVTGPGYQGLKPIDNTTKLAVWVLPRVEAAQHQTLTLTLSGPAPNLRGTLRWAKPAVKADPIVTFNLSRGGRGLQAEN
jgi:mono/diheme cytochrome c family protein